MTSTRKSLLQTAREYMKNNDLSRAEVTIRQAIMQQPDNANNWECLGDIAKLTKKNNSALELYTRCIAIDPASDSAFKKYNNLYKKLNNLQKSSATRLLSQIQLQRGQYQKAIDNIRKAIHLAPNNKENLVHFSRMLCDIRFTSKIDIDLQNDLELALSYAGSNHRYMTLAVLSALKNEEPIKQLILGIKKNYPNNELLTILDSKETAHVLNSSLLFHCLQKTIITDIEFEYLLTKLRELFLVSITTGTYADLPEYNVFLSALALQCFNNEYIFNLSSNESSLVNQLDETINTSVLTNSTADLNNIILLGSYLPLHKNKQAENIAKLHFNKTYSTVIDTQIREHAVENELKLSIQAMTDINSGVSDDVKQQYEENPFPRWLYLPQSIPFKTLDEYIKRLFPNTDNQIQEGKNLDILIAGCGTGLIPCTYSQLFPEANILAIDLSTSSIAYAKRKANELGMTNIEYAQADIQNLSQINRKFDFINCFGVLHHTENTLESWRILNGLLKPKGCMQIGLYSKHARKGVRLARDIVKQKGYISNNKDMRISRSELRKSDNPEIQKLTKSSAFYSMSNYRDLVFHTHEDVIDLVELKSMLEKLDLNFMGFEFDHPEAPQAYNKQFPKDLNHTSLENWNEFELSHPDTFENTYKFWVTNT